MKTKTICFAAILLIFSACKNDKNLNTEVQTGNEKNNEETNIGLNKENQFQGFCTQMPSFSTSDAMAFAYDIEMRDSLRNNKAQYLNSDFYEVWAAQAEFKELISVDKKDSLSFVLNKENKNAVLGNYYGIQGAIIHEKMWKTNDVSVKFIDGQKTIQDRVINYAREWEKYCPIRFTIVNSGKADITISFKDDGYWSYVGTESTKYIPSMSLTAIELEDTENFRGTVLHEFGHALGLIHEHQSPSFDFKWNEQKVLDYYWKHQGWSSKETYDNVIYKYNFGQYNAEDATAFDPLSIMIYYIPAELLDQNTNIQFDRNNKISDLDKQLISKKYF